MWWMILGCVKVSLPGTSFRGTLPPVDEDLSALSTELRDHVVVLSEDIGRRSLFLHPESLERAATYIESTWAEQGYEVHRQPVIHAQHLRPDRTLRTLKTDNLWIRLPGEQPPLVVGAHYDTVPETPGADDNASGVAALLAITARIRRTQPGREVLFVAWTTEEPPFFRGPKQGSAVHAESLDEVYAAISFDMLGYYKTERKTQSRPFPMSLFYPNRGDFVFFVGNTASGRWLRRTGRAFRKSESFPSRGIAAPTWIAGIDWSDHRSYWSKAPAVMITDTSFLRNPHYHEPTDTIETLDVGRLARVTRGLTGMVEQLRTLDR